MTSNMVLRSKGKIPNNILSIQNNSLNKKIYTTNNQKSKIPVISPKSTTNSNHNMRDSNHESRICTIEKEISSIKNLIKTKFEEGNKLIAECRDEFTVKLNRFSDTIEFLKIDINKSSSTVQPYQYNNDTETYWIIRNIIEANKRINTIESKINSCASDINSKIEELQSNNVDLQECLIQLAWQINFIEENVTTSKSGTSSEDLINAIECIQTDSNKVNLSMFKDEEKIIKMNTQIHILSAKFINFNAKINEHFLSLNKKKLMDNNAIIDSDAKHYFTNEKTKNNNKNKEIIKVNIFSNKTMLSHPFSQNFDKLAYSKQIKVIMHNTMIYNITNFSTDFKNTISKILASKLINEVTIAKYRMEDNMINQIEVVVSFTAPINHEYINVFKFPSNWLITTINFQNNFRRQSRELRSQKMFQFQSPKKDNSFNSAYHNGRYVNMRKQGTVK